MCAKVIAVDNAEAACVPGPGEHPVYHEDLPSPELSHVRCGESDGNSQAQRRVPLFLYAAAVGVVYPSTPQGRLPSALGGAVTEVWAGWDPRAA